MIQTKNEPFEGKETNLVNLILNYFNRWSNVVRLHRTQCGKVQVFKHGRLYWMQLAPAGTPDIEGFDLRTGVYIGIECKVKSGRERVEQQEYAELVHKTKQGIHIFARSLQDVIDVLEPRVDQIPF